MKNKIKVTLQQTMGDQFYVAQIKNATCVVPFREKPVRIGTFISRDMADKLCSTANVEVTINAIKV